MAANALSRYPLLVAGCIAAGTSLAALQLGRQAPDSQADTLEACGQQLASHRQRVMQLLDACCTQVAQRGQSHSMAVPMTPASRLLSSLRADAPDLAAHSYQADSQAAATDLGPRPNPADDMRMHGADVVAVRYMLDRQHQEAAQAMTDIELLRFAKSCGLLTDMKPSDRQAVLRKTAERAVATAQWRQEYEFLPAEQMEAWESLVGWRHARGDDLHEPPRVLMVTPREALGSGALAAPLQLCARAIISQTRAGMALLTREVPLRDNRVVVVVDGRGVTALQALKLVWLVKEVSLMLHAHFPGRMAAVWVVQPPAVIDWPLKALKNLLNPEGTGAKINTCHASDPVLPVDLP